ncbi:MAG: exonuclease SbcCD subunit D [Lachnospiraceae bacterium]|nr:exonuclease SbcCD subunit D [Lachnospiraceae bacterium]
MKFLHTGDLHIGKTVNEFSLIEDQRYFLKQIAALAAAEKVDAVVIAGDVYDRSIPSAEAVTVLDEFLSELIALRVPVLMISGNHDSPERVGFADAILEKQGLYIASTPEKGAKKVTLSDAYGTVHFLLMPYVKPAVMEARNNQEAVEKMLQQFQEPDLSKERNVLVTHYFVTNAGLPPEVSDSETTVNVGGLDNVEAETFRGFDYVALGHIHKPQQIGDRPVYYSGTPIKYSFSEVNQEKGINLITLGEKGCCTVERREIKPLHDMRKITGHLEELIKPEIVSLAEQEDYIQATLLNEEELIDPIGTLRSVYPNTMQLILKKNEIAGTSIDVGNIQRSKSMLELYKDFYEIVREEELKDERLEVIVQTIRETEGGENV